MTARRLGRWVPPDPVEAALTMKWHELQSELDRLTSRCHLRLEMQGVVDEKLLRRIAVVRADMEAMRHLRQRLPERT